MEGREKIGNYKEESKMCTMWHTMYFTIIGQCL